MTEEKEWAHNMFWASRSSHVWSLFLWAIQMHEPINCSFLFLFSSPPPFFFCFCFNHFELGFCNLWLKESRLIHRPHLRSIDSWFPLMESRNLDSSRSFWGGSDKVSPLYQSLCGHHWDPCPMIYRQKWSFHTWWSTGYSSHFTDENIEA